MRKSVKEFAEEMEKVLRANDHKSGWVSLSFLILMRKLRCESDELYFEIRTNNRRSDTVVDLERIMHESIDVANYAMMIHYNASRDLYTLKRNTMKEDGKNVK